METGTGPTEEVRSAGGTSRSGGLNSPRAELQEALQQVGSKGFVYRLRSKPQVHLVP